jgi:hypothetical protein
MAEPKILQDGKEFHQRVQKDFLENNKSGEAKHERFVSFAELKRVRRNSRKDGTINLYHLWVDLTN